jgi:hypothetical protein
MEGDNFASRFKKVLDHYNVTAYRVAKDLSYTTPTAVRLLTGQSTPSFEFLIRFGGLYPEVNFNWLVLGEETMFRDPSIRPKTNVHHSPDLLESKNELIETLKENIRLKDEKIDQLTNEMREYRAAAKLLESAKMDRAVTDKKQRK